MAGKEGLIKKSDVSHNMHRFIFLIFVLVSLSFASQKAAFFLLEDPATVRILNKYEQSATEVFLPGTPFRILEKDYRLSDGITPAWKCKLGREFYFLLPIATEPEVLKNCTVLEDTVLLIRDNILLKLSDGSNERLQNGLALERLFQSGFRTYVFAEQYGWCRLTRTSWKTVEHTGVLVADFPEKLHQRIMGRIERANQTYRQFFRFFNQKFHQEQPVPQWLSAKEGTTLSLYLNHPDTTGQLKSSIPVLKEELEQLLFDSNFQCEYDGNRFIFSARSEQ